MAIREVDWSGSGAQARHYLCIDRFIADMSGARALASAFEVGLVDYLDQGLAASAESAAAGLQLDRRGAELLFGMLLANQVLAPCSGDDQAFTLAPAFKAALAYRDLLEAKLHFANQVAPDVVHLMTALLFDPPRFMEHARIFRMFSYQRALVPTAENLEETARWMRMTTALTKYESLACALAFDFSRVRRMLDVGGNSGEFALQMCKAHQALQATVYDLPLVCDIGASHVAGDPAAARVQFVKRDTGSPALSAGQDLVVFKSMLHDWPDDQMHDFLKRAYEALTPGGTLMIFERAQADTSSQPIAYGQWPLMLFFRSYRKPQAYHAALQAQGFHSVAMTEVPLDMPFLLMTAVK